MFKFSALLLLSALGVTKPISILKGSLIDLKRYFSDNGVTEVNWKELFRMPEYKGLCQRTKPILDAIRKTNPKLTPEMIDQAIEKVQDPEYNMSYGKWDTSVNEIAMDVSYRRVEERVLQINQTGRLKQEIAADRMLAKWFSMAAGAASGSDHPVSNDTVGWLRIDEVNQDYLLIDEIQSDVVNAISQAKLYVDTQSWEAFQEEVGPNPTFWAAFRKRIGPPAQWPGYWNSMHTQLPQMGFTSQELERIRVTLNQKFKDWAEVGLSTLIKLAREEGIGMVLINIEDVYKQRDPNFGSEKYIRYYQNLAEKHGFEKVTINTPEISGTFWGRKP